MDKQRYALELRQRASCRVTKTPRECYCRWCVQGPRRKGRMLVNYNGQ